MLHPDTEIAHVDDIVGQGVVCTAPIPRGTITWARDPLDRFFDPAYLKDLPDVVAEELDHFTYLNAAGKLVLCWDRGKFVNHSCEPACILTEFGFEIAVRDIPAGEQMTNDYANLGMAPHKRVDCRCGSAVCRQVIEPKGADALRAGWQRAVRFALPRLNEVAQPLWPLIGAETRQAVRDVLRAMKDPTETSS